MPWERLMHTWQLLQAAWTLSSLRQRSFLHVHSPVCPTPTTPTMHVCPTVRCHLTNVGHSSTPCWLWFLLFGTIKSPLQWGAAPWWGEKGFNRRLHLFCKFARKAHLGLCGPSTSFHQSLPDYILGWAICWCLWCPQISDDSQNRWYFASSLAKHSL